MFSQLKAAALAKAQETTKSHVKSYPISLFSAVGPFEIQPMFGLNIKG